MSTTPEADVLVRLKLGVIKRLLGDAFRDINQGGPVNRFDMNGIFTEVLDIEILIEGNGKPIQGLKSPHPGPRPWSKPEDVPAEAQWFRNLNGCNHQRLIRVCPEGISVVHADMTWAELRKVEWSDRERKVWRPCVTEAAP